jgi:hypothetical protein
MRAKIAGLETSTHNLQVQNSQYKDINKTLLEKEAKLTLNEIKLSGEIVGLNGNIKALMKKITLLNENKTILETHIEAYAHKLQNILFVFKRSPPLIKPKLDFTIDLKAQKFCPNCGESHRLKETYCSCCGAKIK